MKIEPGQMVPLGCGKYFRSDRIVGLEPIEEGRGPGQRTRVYIEQLAIPIVASRSEERSSATWSRCPRRSTKIREQRELLSDLVDTISEINPLLRSIIRDQGSGISTAWKNGSAMSCARMKNDPTLRASRRKVRTRCRPQIRGLSTGATLGGDGRCAAINSSPTRARIRLARRSPRNMTLPQRGVCWVRNLNGLFRRRMVLGLLPVFDERGVRCQCSQLSRRGLRVVQIVAQHTNIGV